MRDEGEKKATRQRWAIILLIVLAFAMHIGHAVFTWRNNPTTRLPAADALYYDNWSEAIAGGSTGGEEPFYLPPLYPHFMALVRLVTGDSLPAMLFVQVMLGLASLWLIHRLAARHFGPLAASLAVLAALFYAPLLFYETKLLATTLTLTLGLLSVELLERAYETRSPRRLASAGLCIGFLCLARPNYLILAALAALPLFPRSRQGAAKAAAFVLGLLIPLGASFTYNLITTGEPVLVSSNGGINFYFGNRGDASGVNDAPTREFSSIFEQKAAARRIAESETERTMSAKEISSFWLNKGFSEIGENPARWLGLLMKKFGLFLSNFEYGVIYIPQVERHLSPFQSIQLIPAALLLALGACGLWLAVRRKVEGLMPLLMFLAASFLTVMIFFMADRFRLPFMAGLLPFAGLYLARGAVNLREKRIKTVITGVAVCALISTASILLVDDHIRTNQVLRNRVSLARAFERAGDLDQAKAEVMKTFEKKKTSAALYQLGLIEERRGELEAAISSYEEASLLDPTYLEPLGALAAVYENRNDWNKALELRSRVIEIVPYRFEGYYNMGLTLIDANRLVEGVRYLDKARDLALDNAIFWAKLGRAYHEVNEPLKALQALKRAVKTDPALEERLAGEIAELEKE